MFKLQNLSKRFSTQKVLSDVSYDFQKQGLVCLLGSSGCGKSTLVNLLAGFDTKYEGKITFENTDLSSLSSDELSDFRRDNIGFVFQDYHLLEGLTCLQNVLMAVFSDKNQTEKAIEILTSLGLSSKINEKVENLSGGQKQRVSIARALIKNPKLILADEPTGALDRKTSTEVMNIFKELSRDRLVIIITHDSKICEFADTVLKIQEGKIIEEKSSEGTDNSDTLILSQVTRKAKMPVVSFINPSSTALSLKFFKRDFWKFLAIGTAVAFGVIAFMMSLSFSNTIQKGISEFQEKNTAFNNGFVKNPDASTFELLNSDERIENVFYQYKLKSMTLSYGDKTSEMPEKIPTPKATNVMSYGVMPRFGKNEIAITPSLAKKFHGEINKLIGENITLSLNGESYTLTVSGIFNAGYDDFFVSSDLEQKLYSNTKEAPFSISFDVKSFEDVLTAIPYLAENNIDVKSAYAEIVNLTTAFNNVKQLFLIVSILILAVGIFIAVLLMVKLQNSKVREFGLLSSLGFHSSILRNSIIFQNLLLGLIAVLINLIFIVISLFFPSFGGFTTWQIALSAIFTLIVTSVIGYLTSIKPLKLDPSTALRKS